LSTVLALATVPEAAVVPEHAARICSHTVYYNILMGVLGVTVETVKNIILLSLELIGVCFQSLRCGSSSTVIWINT